MHNAEGRERRGSAEDPDELVVGCVCELVEGVSGEVDVAVGFDGSEGAIKGGRIGSIEYSPGTGPGALEGEGGSVPSWRGRFRGRVRVGRGLRGRARDGRRNFRKWGKKMA